MIRRTFGLVAGTTTAAVLLSSACAPRAASHHTHVRLKEQKRRAGFPLLVIFTPEGDTPASLIRTLSSEIHRDYDVHVYGSSGPLREGDIEAVVRHSRPDVVVLIDNPTVKIYGQWARKQERPPPAVILMASFADELTKLVPNSTGIAFELPAVRSLTVARRILGVSIEQVGVVARQGFERYVDSERRQAAAEELSFVSYTVRRTPSAREVRSALIALTQSGVDALWVPNDNVLLSQVMVERAWLPVMQPGSIPVIVGVPSLVGNGTRLGTFAIVPDIEAIAVQAVDLIYQLTDSGGRAARMGVQPPLSVHTYVDVQAGRRLGMKKAQEHTVDVLVGTP